MPAPTDRLGPALRAGLATLALPALAVLTAFAVGAGFIALSGGSPLLAYLGLWEGAFGSASAVSETLVWATPYVFAGLAVALAFKAGLFNVGAEGQLAAGAVAAAWVGYALPGLLGTGLPAAVHAPLAVVGGGLAGAAWGGVPGWLKARTGGHEVINTIMMNYVALLLASYLLNGPMRDPDVLNVIARTPEVALSARLPRLFADHRLHWGFVAALGAAALTWWLLAKTTVGFEIRTVGANPDAARYAGMRVGRTIVVSMALSGFLAGLAGAVEVAGLNYRHELSFSLGYGFEAITVALLAKTHPLAVVPAAILMGALRSGATRMQFLTQVPVDVVSVIQALVLLFVGADPIVRFLYRLPAPKRKLVLTRGWG